MLKDNKNADVEVAEKFEHGQIVAWTANGVVMPLILHPLYDSKTVKWKYQDFEDFYKKRK